MKKSFVMATLSLALVGCQLVGKESAQQKTVAPTTPPATAQPPIQPATIAATPVPSPETVPATPSVHGQDEAVLRACLKELNALQQVNQGKYQLKSTELNRLLSEARNYMKVRTSLNSEMSLILDSAFQYRIARTCNDIRVELTRTLLERLERS